MRIPFSHRIPSLFSVYARDEQGQSLVELAITLPVLSLLLLGAVELGHLAYGAIEIANAAHAAASFAAQNPVFIYDAKDTTAAASQEAADLSSVSTTAVQSCYCSSGASFNCQTGQGTCAATDHFEDFVTVTVTGNVTPLFNVAFLPSSITLTSTATMRLQED